MFEGGSWIPGTGTFINIVTVTVGGLLGVALGDRLPERMRRTIMQGLGLVTVAVALSGMEPLFDPDDALRRFVILIAAMIVGGLLGEALSLEERLESAGEKLRARFVRSSERDSHTNFIEGFVVASTVFCVGPLTIVGAVEDGLGISIKLLAIKSALDGFGAIGFASVYGWGVLAALITLVVYQGGMTAAAAVVEPLMTDEVLAVLGATGSLLVLGIGLRLLDIARIRVVALLPALIIGPAIAGVVEVLA